MELTNYLENPAPLKTKTIATVVLRLDKETMVKMLLSDAILLYGKRYIVPEQYILQLLMNKQYGEIKLNLELIP